MNRKTVRKSFIALLLAIILFASIFLPAACSCNEELIQPKTETKTTNLGLVHKTGKVSNPTKDVSISVFSDGKVANNSNDGELVYNKSFIANSADSITAYTAVRNVRVGDVIQITADYQYIKVELLGLSEVILFSPTGEFVYQIPATGTPNWQTPYPAGAFTQSVNTITASIPTDAEIRQERNLALNPYDYAYKNEINVTAATDTAPLNSLPADSISVSTGEVVSYPHAYANRITTGNNRPSFLPRNAIDGSITTGGSRGHINYGAHSWGGGQFDDLEYVVYFGREVSLSELSFVMRADYTGSPEHDTYWEEITVEFSDKSEQVLSGFEKGSERQTCDIDDVTTSFVRLKDFKRNLGAHTAGWAALTEIEAYGNDIRDNSAATKTTVSNTWGGKKTNYTTDAFSAGDLKKIIDFASEDVTEVVKIKNSSGVSESWWRDGVLYSALMDAYMTTGTLDQYLYIRNAADKYQYTIKRNEGGRGNRTATLASIVDGYTGNGSVVDFADDYLVGETYLWLNDLKPAAHKLFNTYANADANMLNKPSWDVRFNTGLGYSGSGSWTRPNPENIFDWWWCDAIYMGLNTFTMMSQNTGDADYAEKAFRSYKHWKNILCCTNNHNGHADDWGLWHRDTDNVNIGKNNSTKALPTFWARGNAWVIAALAKQMLYIEDTNSEMYQTYEEDFMLMAKTLKNSQRPDGAWNPSIIDDSHKAGLESTGTSGFVYALTVGVQLGILDAGEYMPVIEKGFKKLLEMRLENGRLGYMQDVGYDAAGYPGEASAKTATNAFGYGLFIHAASALMRMCSDYEAVELSIPADAQYGVAKVPEYTGVKS